MIVFFIFLCFVGSMIAGLVFLLKEQPRWALFMAFVFILSLLALAFFVDRQAVIKNAENFVDLSTCAVIGTAKDVTRARAIYRKIYKCPNDTLHIR